MPKLKQHRALLKRVKITGTGKIKFRRAFTGHLRSHKSGRQLMKLRSKRLVKSSDIGRIERMLGRTLQGVD